MAKIVVGNMKNSMEECNVIDYVKGINNLKFDNIDLILCPSFIHLNLFKGNNYKLGAQDVYFSSDLCTGEISINQLKKIGVSSILVGHAERRVKLNESNEVINKKVRICLENNINVILCIGEEKIEESITDAFNSLKNQLLSAFANIEIVDIKNIIVAYEPVYAIGTDSFIDIDRIKNIKEFIDSIVLDLYGNKCNVIYGGSVNEKNIKDIICIYDGVMLGKVSTDYDKFSKLLQNIN